MEFEALQGADRGGGSELPLEEVAEYVFRRLLEDRRYAGLTKQDLIAAGIMEENETEVEFMIRQLELDTTVLDAARRRLADKLGLPAESNDRAYLCDAPFDYQQEVRVRKNVLVHQHNVMMELLNRTDMSEFCRRVWDAVGILQNENVTSADPEQVDIQDFETAGQLFGQAPEMREINGRWCFTLIKPSRPEEHDERDLIQAFSQLMGGRLTHELFVVVEQKKADELSKSVVAHVDLRNYYLALELRYQQERILEKIVRMFGEVAREKHNRLTEQVREINKPVQLRFFQLLIEQSKEKNTQVVMVKRDIRDAKAVAGEWQPSLDRTSSESDVVYFDVCSDGTQLVVTWESRLPETRQEDGEKVTAYHPEQKKVAITVNESSGDVLIREFTTPDQDDADQQAWISYSNEPGKIPGAIRSLIESVTILNVDGLLGQPGSIGELSQLSRSTLLQATSATEFAQHLRDFTYGSYPRTEVLVNTNPTLEITVPIGR